MEERQSIYEQYFKEDEQQFLEMQIRYAEINEEDIPEAYELSKKALALSDRWSEIKFIVKKMEHFNGRDPAYKERCYERYRNLQEMHTHLRVTWNKGEERARRG